MGSAGSKGSFGKKCPKGCYPIQKPQQQRACTTAYPPMIRPQAPMMPMTQQCPMPQMQIPQVRKKYQKLLLLNI